MPVDEGSAILLSGRDIIGSNAIAEGIAAQIGKKLQCVYDQRANGMRRVSHVAEAVYEMNSAPKVFLYDFWGALFYNAG